jgi:hypothetical protein
MRSAWIFLDFDGVLNSDAYYTKSEKARTIGDVDPRAISCLNDLVSRSGAKVVISSNWRRNMSLGELREVLVKKGFKHPNKVVAKTPDLGDDAVRGYEILAFLKRKGALKSPFVVLDDTDDMDGVEDAFVRTAPREGLQASHVEKALLILSRRDGGAKAKEKAKRPKKRRILLPRLKPASKRFTWTFD